MAELNLVKLLGFVCLLGFNLGDDVYTPGHSPEAISGPEWSRAIKDRVEQSKRVSGASEPIQYGELIKYLNSVGKRDTPNTVHENGMPGLNNPYFRKFEDAVKFDELRRYLQRIGRR